MLCAANIDTGADDRLHLLPMGVNRLGACVFDLMEPQRPIVDRKVLEFMQAHTFHPADFTIRSDGVCRLNPELARYVARIV
jgi:CRISPR/Cas system-associated endonuclease Cas1